MIVDPDIETTTRDHSPKRTTDEDEKDEAARGRDAGTTSGTENYGSTEEANKGNPPSSQTEPSY